MLFEHFPYSNFHNLNLDWIIREMKKLIGITEQATDTANEAKNQVESAVTSAAEAKSAAENAKTAADAAKAAADAAVDVATTSADEAKEVADRALTTANGATTVANAARTSADTAVGTANTANNTASTAMQTAARAETVADGIDGKATKAMEDAAAALADITNVSENAYAPRGVQDLASGAKPFNTVDAGGAVVAYKPSAPLGTDNMDAVYDQIPWGPFIDCSFAYQKAEGDKEGGAFHLFAPNDDTNWGMSSEVPVTVSHMTPSGQAAFLPLAYLPLCKSVGSARLTANAYKSSLDYTKLVPRPIDFNSLITGEKNIIVTDASNINGPEISTSSYAFGSILRTDCSGAKSIIQEYKVLTSVPQIYYRTAPNGVTGVLQKWHKVAFMDDINNILTQIESLTSAINAPLKYREIEITESNTNGISSKTARTFSRPYPADIPRDSVVSITPSDAIMFDSGTVADQLVITGTKPDDLLATGSNYQVTITNMGANNWTEPFSYKLGITYREPITLPTVNTLDLPPEEWDSMVQEFSEETSTEPLAQTNPAQTELS